ncbi:hypothetical protein WJX79_009347 [Trebouxia sp. C0005]
MKALRGASFDPSFDRGHSTGHSTCRHQTSRAVKFTASLGIVRRSDCTYNHGCNASRGRSNAEHGSGGYATQVSAAAFGAHGIAPNAATSGRAAGKLGEYELSLCTGTAAPTSLDRRDSRLQMDLAGIQKRLHKIAQLRDTPPSSPRSGERISSWTSPRSPDLGRSRTLGSRLSPLKQSPSRTGTMSPIPKQSERDDDMPSQAHVSFAERHSGPSELFYKTESISATTGTRHDGNSTAESRLNDAVSLDSSDSTRLSKKLQQSE